MGLEHPIAPRWIPGRIKRRTYLQQLLPALLGGGWAMLVGGKAYPMSDEPMMRDLFDRWERVWHEGHSTWYRVASGSTIPGMTREATGRSRARPMRPRLQRFGRSGQISVSWYTIICLKVTVRGFGLRSNGQIRKPTSSLAEPGCSPIGSRTTSSLRHGFQCSRQAQRGAMPPLRSIGRVRLLLNERSAIQPIQGTH
jgi:hypothetical protein